MADKMLELLEKMYIEIQDIKSNMATKEDLSKVEQGIKYGIVRLENKMDENQDVEIRVIRGGK